MVDSGGVKAAWPLPAWFAGCLIVILGVAPAWAKPPVVRFASVEVGRRELARKDEFTRRLSAFDRAARLKSGDPVSEAQFLEFVGAQVLAWEGPSRALVEKALGELTSQLEGLPLRWPEPVWLIRTTGREEGRAAYTRGSSIVIPDAKLEKSPALLADLLAHELFHVLSRANPLLRTQLYAAIGFTPCPEVKFPPALASRRITNPDAPAFDQSITVRVAGQSQRVVPVLHASLEHYPAGDTREFFELLKFGFWPLDVAQSNTVPILLDAQKLSGFDEQVGKNTGYIIHPEEIVADNFKLIVRQSTNVPSPEVLQRIEGILRQKPTVVPGPAWRRKLPRARSQP